MTDATGDAWLTRVEATERLGLTYGTKLPFSIERRRLVRDGRWIALYNPAHVEEIVAEKRATVERNVRIRELWDAGQTVRDIDDGLGLIAGTARYVLRRSGVKSVRRAQGMKRDTRTKCQRCGIVLEEAMKMQGVLSDCGDGLCGLCRRGW